MHFIFEVQILGLSSSLKLFFCSPLARIKFYLFYNKTHVQLGPEAEKNVDTVLYCLMTLYLFDVVKFRTLGKSVLSPSS